MYCPVEPFSQEHLRLEFQRFKDSLAIEKAEEHRREASERKTMQREEEEQRKREAAVSCFPVQKNFHFMLFNGTFFSP